MDSKALSTPAQQHARRMNLLRRRDVRNKRNYGHDDEILVKKSGNRYKMVEWKRGENHSHYCNGAGFWKTIKYLKKSEVEFG
jgi:hypothetical protein